MITSDYRLHGVMSFSIRGAELHALRVAANRIRTIGPDFRGQHLVDNFPVLAAGRTPRIDPPGLDFHAAADWGQRLHCRP